MAQSVEDLKVWLRTLSPEAAVAVDDGGLTLVELDSSGQPTGAYYELGGIPEEE